MSPTMTTPISPTPPTASPSSRPGPVAETYGIPLALLAELTHRCPLQCPYCSNPLELERAGAELTTAEWGACSTRRPSSASCSSTSRAASRPCARTSRSSCAHAAEVGLYTNLITSAVLLTRDEARGPAPTRGLDHVQISFQGAKPSIADRIAGYHDGHAKKLEVGQLGRASSACRSPSTPSMHRQNLDQLAAMIDLAVELGADRLEVAHVQYYGWALKNRAALMPTLAQLDETTAHRRARPRERLQGHPRHRLRHARLLRRAAQALHGRLGPAVLQHHAVGQGAALPRRRNHHRARASTACASNHSIAWIWQQVRRVQPLPRHRLDAGALPLLRLQGESTSAAAAARPSPSPAMPPPPIRPASCRRSTSGSSRRPRSRRRRAPTASLPQLLRRHARSE